GEPPAALGRRRAALTDALGRAPKVAVPLVDGAHHGDTAERRGTLALLVEHLEQTPALRALGVHPAELDPDARDGKAARPHQREYVGGGLALLRRAREVHATQLDAVPADASRDAQDLGERRRVERPGVEREHPLLGLRRGPAGGRGSAARGRLAALFGMLLRVLERLLELAFGLLDELECLGAVTAEVV